MTREEADAARERNGRRIFITVAYGVGLGLLIAIVHRLNHPAPLTIEGVCRAVTVNDAPGLECRAIEAPKP